MFDAEILRSYKDGELIPLQDVALRVGLNRGTQSYAVRTGGIVISDKRGPHGRYLIAPDEALMIIMAASLATALGVAVVVALRAVRDMGARAIPGGLMIPLAPSA